jgi:hypothetical protein
MILVISQYSVFVVNQNIRQLRITKLVLRESIKLGTCDIFEIDSFQILNLYIAYLSFKTYDKQHFM